MGVNTSMLNAGLDASEREGLGARVVAAAGEVLEPEDVAEAVVEAMRREQFLILPHPGGARVLPAAREATTTGGSPACSVSRRT